MKSRPKSASATRPATRKPAPSRLTAAKPASTSSKPPSSVRIAGASKALTDKVRENLAKAGNPTAKLMVRDGEGWKPFTLADVPPGVRTAAGALLTAAMELDKLALNPDLLQQQSSPAEGSAGLSALAAANPISPGYDPKDALSDSFYMVLKASPLGGLVQLLDRQEEGYELSARANSLLFLATHLAKLGRDSLRQMVGAIDGNGTLAAIMDDGAIVGGPVGETNQGRMSVFGGGYCVARTSATNALVVWDKLIHCLNADNGCQFRTTRQQFERARPYIQNLLIDGYFTEADYLDPNGSYMQAAAGEREEAKGFFSSSPLSFMELQEALNAVTEDCAPAPSTIPNSSPRSVVDVGTPAVASASAPVGSSSADSARLLTPAQQLVQNAVRAYEAATADHAARIADCAAARERIKAASEAERVACGALSAAKEEATRAYMALETALRQQAPECLVKVGDKLMAHTTNGLVQFPAHVVTL